LKTLSRLVLLGILLAAMFAGPARAHLGGEPLVLVPLDHVLPGESFPLTGADLGEDAVVKVELKQDKLVVALGSITAGSDGHFQSSLDLPSTFPDGYAELVASSSDGSEASTWILVGERNESTPPPPGRTEWGRGRTAVVLALVLGVAGAALAFGAMRSGRRARGGRPE
jgi:hypothetical protein